MKGLRSSIVLCILVHVALVVGKVPDWISPDMLDMVKGDKDRCMKEHGTSQAVIDDAADGKFVDDRSLSCYMFCLFESFSLADEDGNIDVDLLGSILPEQFQASAVEVFGSCNQPDGDPCDKFLSMAKCAAAKRPDMWFMI